MPLVSAVLGLIVVSQYRDISHGGEYIEQVLRPAIARYKGNGSLFGWEIFYWRRKHTGTWPGGGMGLIFPDVSTLALVITLPAARTLVDRVAWVVGAGLLLLLASWTNRLTDMARA